MRNFHMALMLSFGIPMILMGDEYAHTKLGNNNSWCQDNAINWFLWDKLAGNQGFYRFYKMMIQLRKNNPLLRRDHFIKQSDIVWHGLKPFEPNWGADQRIMAFSLKDFDNDNDIYVAFNASENPITVELPDLEEPKAWKLIVNTANLSPDDIVEEKDAKPIAELAVTMPAYSAVLLKAL
jgi:isoamylase